METNEDLDEEPKPTKKGRRAGSVRGRRSGDDPPQWPYLSKLQDLRVLEGVAEVDGTVKVHAATFNAGNKKFKEDDDDWMDVLTNMLAGSEESDIVLLGFQEIYDPDLLLQPKAKQMLWGGGPDITTARQTWSSGLGCHIPKHYDTQLYVFVNPASSWTIALDSYASDTCPASTHDRGSAGCSIDNNQKRTLKKPKGECGKVVNILRFNATRAGDRIIFCAMNTHMSRKGGATKRLGYMIAAVGESLIAGCDSFVFLGDFNTRPDCQRDEKTEETEPVSKHRDDGDLSSMETLLKLFKQSGVAVEAYALTGDHKYADEMTQFLHKKNVRCFEGGSITDLANPLAGHILELSPMFNPTYKLAPEAKASSHPSPPAFYHCVQGMKKCYANKKGERKTHNNPAWPDRILAYGSGGVKVLDYKSVDVDLESDHMPVVGRVAVAPPKPVQAGPAQSAVVTH